MKRNHGFSVLFLAIINILFCSTAEGQSFRVYPSTVTQTEPVVAVSPLNPNIMFVSAVTINTSNGFRSEGVYVSTNRGLTWQGTDTCSGSYIFNHGGDPGVAITNNGTLILTHIGSTIYGVYAHYSTNLGTSWSNAYTLTIQQPEDKGTLSFDGDSSSPYFGRVYCAWVNFVSPFPVLFSYTSNSGQNWLTPIPINGTPPSRCSGGFVKTGINGMAYIVWAGVQSIPPFSELYAGFASSSNGGSNWNYVQNIFNMNGINGTLPEKGNIRVNGLPSMDIDKATGPRRGWIYVVTNEKNLSPAGSDPDIILHRSTNNGNTWSAGIRVNQDAINNGRIQYFPSISVDTSGAVNIMYYDDRNTTSDSAEVFLARSQDGGNTWSEKPISGHRFKPKPIVGGASGYQGDRITLVSSGGKLFAFWMDDYSGIYQVWTNILDMQTIGVKKIDSEIPSNYSLKQNFPNPFNPSTKILYELPTAGNVILSVYDITGKEIAVLVNERQSAGTYETVFDASYLPSGIYYYKLKAGNFSESRKMILVK